MSAPTCTAVGDAHAVLDADEVHAALVAAITDAGGQTAFARAHGVQPSYVNDVVQGRRSLNSRFVRRALGFCAVTRFVRCAPASRDR